MTEPAVLMLEDDSVFHGHAVGADGCSVGEVVFNTAMTGYQEILTDPSYARQIITFTCPHIGNTGVNSVDTESAGIHAAGIIIREYPELDSCWRSEGSLRDYLRTAGVVGMAGVDTRRLTRLLRSKGAMRGVIACGRDNIQSDLRSQLEAFSGLKGMDLASLVSTRTRYEWHEGEINITGSEPLQPRTEPLFRVSVLDFGIKKNILRRLVEHGCVLDVLPAHTSAAQILAEKPDGVCLSNGPGDPDACGYAIDTAKQLLEAGTPMIGICLGHQILALAAGARTVKMKTGHHGANHPVQALDSGQVMISSQNHGFVVDAQTLPECLEVTHTSLFDGSIQGLRHLRSPALGFQGHPEASPGPHDVDPVFTAFIRMMQSVRTGRP